MILRASDMLITDNSSIVWDYSFLFSPCFLFAPDLDGILKNTGFYLSIFEWSFTIARTQVELHQHIRVYDHVESCKAIEKHHHYMRNFETSCACECTTKRIFDVCMGIKEK